MLIVHVGAWRASVPQWRPEGLSWLSYDLVGALQAGTLPPLQVLQGETEIPD